MTQHEKIMRYLKERGSISPMEAFQNLGITKLSTRISEMRKSGIQFVKTYVTGKNRDGETDHYMRYSLRD